MNSASTNRVIYLEYLIYKLYTYNYKDTCNDTDYSC